MRHTRKPGRPREWVSNEKIVEAHRLTTQLKIGNSREAKISVYMMGASLAVIGLNYNLYVVYLYYVNWLNTLLLVDVWTLPPLGLGLTVLVSSRRMRELHFGAMLETRIQ